MEETLQAAQLYHSHGLFKEAVFTYLQAATESPEYKQRITDNFISSLSQLLGAIYLPVNAKAAPTGVAMDTDQTLKQFLELARAVCCVFGGNDTVLRMVAEKCMEFGPCLFKYAQFFLEAALQVDPDSLLAKENLRNLFHQFVNRWHFVMLNDVHRNSAYFQAIRKAVGSIPGCTVLDIGSGTGILSMMALQSGSKRVYGCEVNEAMAAMSHDILSSNGIRDDVITIINSLSTSLCVPANLPHRVSLVVTETVDAGLLGEHVIPSLRHAWREFLEPTNQIAARGHVIPCGATVYATAIECSEIRKQSKLLDTQVGGVKFDGVLLEGSCKMLGDGRGTGKSPAVVALETEPYTCERLAVIRRGYRVLTTPTSAMTFDFGNPEVPLPPPTYLHLPVTGSGKLDAIAVWFDLHLDKDITISTSPSPSPSSCDSHYSPGAWEQAIFPVRRTLPGPNTSTPIELAESDVIVLHVSCTDILLQMEVENVVCKDLDSTHHCDEVMGGCELKGTGFSGKTCREKPVFYIERGELLRLNDSWYIEAYTRALSLRLSETKQRTACQDIATSIQRQLSDMAIDGVNTSELQPSANCQSGEMADTLDKDELQPSANCQSGEMADTLDRDELQPSANCQSGEMEDALDKDESAQLLVLDMTCGFSIFGLVAAMQGADFVQLGRTHSMYKPLLEQLAQQNGIREHVSFQHLDVTRMPGLEWDLVLCDVVSPQGVLHSRIFEELAFLRSRYFHSESSIIPNRVTVQAVVMSSPWLRAQTCVLGDAHTCGFNIATTINTYQVSHFTDVDLSTIPHTPLTAIFDLLTVDMNSLTADPLQLENRVTVGADVDGVATGIAYWFSLGLHGDVAVVTGPNGYEGSHWHQAVFILREEVPIKKGQSLLVRALLRESCLDLSLQG